MKLLTIEETYTIFRRGFPENPVQILVIRPSYVKVRMPSNVEKLLRPGGSIAGPTLMEFADVAMYIILIAHLGESGYRYVTSNFNISFLRRAMPGEMVAEVSLLKSGKRQSVGDIRIYTGGSQEPVAHVVSTNMFVDSAG